MMRGKPIFLYEDKGSNHDFGLHSLICACVADVLGGLEDVHSLIRRTDPQPLGGDGNVRNACKTADLVARRGQPVVAIFDGDKVRRLLAMSPTASEAAVVATIRKETTAPPNLEIMLLERNLESVLDALEQCHRNANAELLARAKRKKGNERDQVLNAIAKNYALRTERDCILARLPSLKAIVDWAVRQLATCDVR